MESNTVLISTEMSLGLGVVGIIALFFAGAVFGPGQIALKWMVKTFGAFLMLQGIVYGLSVRDFFEKPGELAAETRRFDPATVEGSMEDKGLYLRRIQEELTPSLRVFEIGLDAPFEVKILVGNQEFPYRFDMMSHDFCDLEPEAAVKLMLYRIQQGPAERQPGEGFFPSTDDIPALLNQAFLAWEIGDHQRSIHLAEKALAIRRSLMGNYDPRVMRLEEQIAAARDFVK